ncbi:CobW family GTP-binding protein [Haloferacaceae archaeon DSL9]
MPLRRETIPVTILSGSLGAGKTTLLNHLLRNAGDRDIAVLVNDMGEVNIDADLISDSSELDIDDGIAELSNGCICCELQDDLQTAVVRLARERNFDHLVVESSGISEPEPVARLFTTDSKAAALYAVDALVTVVDTRLFVDSFSGDAVPERRGPDEDDTRPMSDLLIEQIEFSNVVLLNKADLCSDAELDRAESYARGLQPDATVLRTQHSAVDPDQLLRTDLFDPESMSELAGWRRALAADEDDSTVEHDAQAHHHGHSRGEGDDHDQHDHDSHAHHDHDSHDHDHHDHAHPDEVYGVTSFTYRRRRPFHPARIREFFASLPSAVIRSKGTCWIAGREDVKVGVSQAGPSAYAEVTGRWIASLPELDRQLYRSNRRNLAWDEEWGDRRTELVFIGIDADEEALVAALDDCLLTDDELAASWERLDNPFPDEPDERLTLREPPAATAE